MKIKSLLSVAAIAAVVFLSSCTAMNKSMRETNILLELKKDDFTLSQQVTGEATEVKILGIDFARLFVKKTGTISAASSEAISLSSLPVIGAALQGKCAMYALYEMMNANPGYDVIMYPQYEKKTTGIPIIFTTTTVKATAKLGKLK